MDHVEAIRLSAVDKYLLNELSPEMRDAFEEHYFDCKECMTDLQATTAFMEAARQEFKSNPVQKPASSPALGNHAVRDIPAVISNPIQHALPQPSSRKRNLVYIFFQKPAIAGVALAASLLVIIYQNAVVYPHLESEVAQVHSPEILSTLSLAGSNSRGGSLPSLTVGAAHPYLLSVDIPAEDRFVSYTCELHSPSGKILWRIPVTNEAAKDLVTIHAPAIDGNSGRYFLVVQGNTNAISSGNSDAGSIELARDAFELSVQH